MRGDNAGKAIRATRKGRAAVARRRSKRSSGTSIYEVAQRAGVSIVTVSRVFNDYPHVSPAMRDHVLKAARDIGYQPRLVAKRQIIGVLLGELDDLAAGEQTSRLVLALMRAAATRGYLIEFIPVEYAERATQHLADGLIALGLQGEQLLSLRNLPPVPRVVLNSQEVDDSWNVVTLDPFAEVHMAVRHLVENGHRHITLVRSTARTWPERQREAGFNAALNEAGLDGHHIITCPYREPSADLARKVQATACTACICLCHHGGLPVLDGLQNELKVRVPDELSLITLENRRVSGYLNPRLTTISQPLEQLAEETMDCLLQSARAQQQRSVSVLKSDLIIRDSVRRLGSPGR